MEAKANRLDGLDVARYLAFVGMVIVNFNIVMGAEADTGIARLASSMLSGRAAATFIVLAGVGLGLAAQRGKTQMLSVTLKRAALLLVIGLLNMLVFDADILHYYAFYFLLGVFLLPLKTGSLIALIGVLNFIFVVMVLTLNYDAGWDWDNYSYEGFWTPIGFIRNLFFNGWHPVIPWLGFLLFGFIVSRMTLAERSTQHRLMIFGALTWLGAEVLAKLLQPLAAALDKELPLLVTTSPIPPMPLYTLAGIGAASLVIGLCLRLTDAFRRTGILKVTSPAGRQTLTLYIAHILIGMGVLSALDMLGNQTAATALIASLIFCLLATLYALLWKRRFKRGPIEQLMRSLAG